MYLMYVDESGDPGLNNSPSQYFILSGLVVHELKWRDLMNDVQAIRKSIKEKYGIGVRDEIHCSEFIRKAHISGIPKHIRLQVLRDITRELAKINYISITNVCIDKQGKPADYDVFLVAWKNLFQRFENTLMYRNFPGPVNTQDMGIIFCDDTSGKELQKLVRKMSVYNPIPNQGRAGYRDMPIKMIVEDPNMRDSKDSLIIQMADLCAYMMYQHKSPNAYIQKKTGRGFFKQLTPILNLKASPRSAHGIVEL